MIIQGVSQQYAISNSMLANKLKLLYVLKTEGQALSLNSHKTRLVEGILHCLKSGFPITPPDIKLLVKGYLIDTV